MLVTTLTKRMAEELTEYLAEHGVKVRYLHSEIETVERVEIIRDLRLGEFDVLVGINLLREGLDLPEVSLVAILDADKEGFLRSERSLIQTIGRAARHLNGTGDPVRRPGHRLDAKRHRRDRAPPRQADRPTTSAGITPRSVVKRIKDLIDGVYDAERSGAGSRRRSALRGHVGEADRARDQAARTSSSRRRRGCATSWRCCKEQAFGASCTTTGAHHSAEGLDAAAGSDDRVGVQTCARNAGVPVLLRRPLPHPTAEGRV